MSNMPRETLLATESQLHSLRDPRLVAFTKRLADDMDRLRGPGACRYFADDAYSLEYQYLGNVAFHLLMTHLPEAEQWFFDAWGARHLLFRAALRMCQGEGDKEDWQWAAHQFIEKASGFILVVTRPHLIVVTTPPPAHSNDFRSLYWFGASYNFTPMQAECVRVLWDAWEQRTPDVTLETILTAIRTGSNNLRYVFNRGRHPAWKNLIVSRRKGTYRLAEPD
jgi:hypothetical protein